MRKLGQVTVPRKNSRRMHNDPATGKHVSDQMTADDDHISFNLSLDQSTGINNEGILGEDLTFEIAANSDGAFKSEFTFKRSAAIKKRSQLTRFNFRTWRPNRRRPVPGPDL